MEDALFATLDPTVRRAHTPDGRLFTIADTVGFVRHLPHQLIEALRSTLEEVADADLIPSRLPSSTVPSGSALSTRWLTAWTSVTPTPSRRG